MDGTPDRFYVDEDKYLLDMYRAGSVISYISMLLNIVIFTILCRKPLRSPATIIMQGLAAADLFTAMSCYGLEPVFQSKYICPSQISGCYLPYPYCSIAHHLAILSFTFHNVSTMLTTCLGIQKVIAILFPIWTKNELTKHKTVICCVMCFLLSVAIGIPRHFSIWSEKYNDHNFTDFCRAHSGGDDILEYSTVTYILIQTVLLTSCCLVMLISTIFIVYKLITNKFTGRMTEQRRQERRSVAMIIAVLIVFFITEVPKVILYLLWCFLTIFLINSVTHKADNFLMQLVIRNEQAMKYLLATYKLINGKTEYSIAMWLVEGIRLFTIIGCMSNFIVYIMMSTKMRNEIVLLYKEIITRCTHKDQMNQIRETAHGRTQLTDKTAMIATEQPGQNLSHEKEMTTIEQPGHSRINEVEMNKIKQPGHSHTHEVEINRSEQSGHGRTHAVEINTIEPLKQRYTQEVEMNTMEQPRHSRTHEIEMNRSELPGQSRTHEVEMNTTELLKQCHTHEVVTITAEHHNLLTL